MYPTVIAAECLPLHGVSSSACNIATLTYDTEGRGIVAEPVKSAATAKLYWRSVIVEFFQCNPP